MFKLILRRIYTLLAYINIIFWTTFVLYLYFYTTYSVPKEISRDVHFSFSSLCPKEVKIRERCSWPTATVLLRDKLGLQGLTPGQNYAVNLFIEVPESPNNANMGMFLVSSVFYSSEKKILETERTGCFRYKSLLLRSLETLFFLPFYLLSHKKQSQDLNVEITAKFIENPYAPTSQVNITIQSLMIDIYQAKVVFSANLTGIQYYLYWYPFSVSFFVIIASIFCVVTIFIVRFWAIKRNVGGPVQNVATLARGQQTVEDVDNVNEDNQTFENMLRHRRTELQT